MNPFAAGSNGVEALEELRDALDEQEHSRDGMTNLNGQTIGRQGLASEVSPIWNEWKASCQPK